MKQHPGAVALVVPSYEEGVRFLEAPRDGAYGIVALFCDPFGNKWDLNQHRPNAQSAV